MQQMNMSPSLNNYRHKRAKLSNTQFKIFSAQYRLEYYIYTFV